MKQVKINDRLTYLVPSHAARASFLACGGLMVNDSRKVIIDSNMGPDETTPFLERENPDVCVVSHFHVDHSRWGHEAARVPDVEMFVPEQEWRYLADVDHFVERCGVPADLAGQWKDWLRGFAGLNPVPDAKKLKPGEVIDVGQTRIEVVAAPGHSPGHQGFWIARDEILFCVDIGVDRFGPWYGWQDCDLCEYIHSVHRFVDIGAKVLVTSHGGIIEHDVEATLLGVIDVMKKRESVIAPELEGGSSVMQIAQRGHIYGDFSRFPPPLDRMYLIWEHNMIAEHARVIEMGGLASIWDS